MAVSDVVHGVYPAEQARIEQRIQEVFAAAREKDFARLESYHLYGPKFSKFDDLEPLDRQDAETARRLEREGIEGLKSIRSEVSHLKVDVFGPAAVATFVFDYGATTLDDEKFSARARGTFVLVKDGSEWRIVHEHFSPFKSNP